MVCPTIVQEIPHPGGVTVGVLVAAIRAGTMPPTIAGRINWEANVNAIPRGGQIIMGCLASGPATLFFSPR